MTSWVETIPRRGTRGPSVSSYDLEAVVSKALIRTWMALAVVFLSWTFSCRAAFDAEAEKAAVKKVIEANIAWFQDKDFGVLFGTCSQGPDLLMFQLDTASTIRGFAEFEKYSAGWRNPDVAYAGHAFTDLKITLSKLGDAAWFSTILEDCARVKDRPPRCFTSRYTGVLEKRDGRWLIVQQHFSLPAEKLAEDWPARAAHPPASGGGLSRGLDLMQIQRRDIP